MFVADRPLMASHHPLFQVRDDQMNARQQFRRAFVFPFKYVTSCLYTLLFGGRYPSHPSVCTALPASTDSRTNAGNGSQPANAVGPDNRGGQLEERKRPPTRSDCAECQSA